MSKFSKKVWVFGILILSGLLGFSISLYRELHQPYTPPVYAIQTFHYPALFVKQLKGDPKAGEKIFKEFCRTCHDKKPLIDVPAPRIGNKKIWEKYQKLGKSLLLELTIKGVGAMPARGGCFECSDEQLAQAIQYMLDESKK